MIYRECFLLRVVFYNRVFPESCLFWLTQVSVVFVSYTTFFSLLSVEGAILKLKIESGLSSLECKDESLMLKFH
jgi:hypothetical protein